MNKKVVSISIGLSMFLFGMVSVSAFTTENGTTNDANTITIGKIDTKQTSTCVVLKSNYLRYRASDAITNGEVSVLQYFLSSQGFLTAAPTGYFGANTVNAVSKFQRVNGFPATGSVGPLTKAKIKEISCGVSSLPVSPIDPLAGANPSQTNPNNPPVTSFCTMEARFCPNGAMMPRDTATCAWYPEKCQGGANPPSLATDTRPVMCTMEARLCPDGSMMPRNSSTCEWYPSKCTGTVSPGITCYSQGPGVAPYCGPCTPGTVCGATTTDAIKQGIIKNLPIIQTPSVPQPQPTKPIACTMEARLCPDGTAMARNPLNCEWLTQSCVASTIIKPTSPSVPITPTKPTPAPVPTMPVGVKAPIGIKPGIVACTMEMRMCPDGMPMLRDPDCTWRSDKCSQGVPASSKTLPVSYPGTTSIAPAI